MDASAPVFQSTSSQASASSSRRANFGGQLTQTPDAASNAATSSITGSTETSTLNGNTHGVTGPTEANRAGADGRDKGRGNRAGRGRGIAQGRGSDGASVGGGSKDAPSRGTNKDGRAAGKGKGTAGAKGSQPSANATGKAKAPAAQNITTNSVSADASAKDENDGSDTANSLPAQAAEDDDDGEMCFICAEVATLWAVGVCGHRTCHTCSIRLRALYKKRECTFCKTECDKVIFTTDPERPYSDYDQQQLPYADTRLGIMFETRAQMDDSIALLRFNCPSPTCSQVLSSWAELKKHVRSLHRPLAICDLCSQHKRIFAHEHALHDTQGSEMSKHLTNEHAKCDFCRRSFYDNDALFKHCRETHEECFVCVRMGIRHQYHLNYEYLEAHFKAAHFICPHPDCLAQKFVVFETELDLQAHAVEAHNASLAGDQKARKEARRIETNFNYGGATDASSGSGSSSNNRRRGGARSAASGSAQGPVEAAFVRTNGNGHDPLASVDRANRIVPGLGGAAASAAGRRAGFGAALTGPSTGGRNGRGGDAGAMADGADEATRQKHAEVMNMVQSATGGSEHAMTSFKLIVRSYRANEVSSDDVVDQLWHILEQREDVAQPIIAKLADLFGADNDNDKKTSLWSAWNDLKDQQNQFPSLAPLGPAVHGVPVSAAPSASSSRALNNTKRPSGRRGAESATAVWDRVERAATSSASSSRPAVTSNPFPALATNRVPGMPAPRKAAVRTTPWAGAASASSSASASASASSSRATTPTPRPAPPPIFSAPPPANLSRSTLRPPPTSSASAFPSLPSSAVEAEKRARVRAALAKPPAISRGGSNAGGGWVDRLITNEGWSPGEEIGGGGVWGPEPSASASASSTGTAGVAAANSDGAAAGGKKKKKGKVLLMSHGSLRG